MTKRNRTFDINDEPDTKRKYTTESDDSIEDSDIEESNVEDSSDEDYTEENTLQDYLDPDTTDVKKYCL